jgi:hypothetical protein
MEEDMLYREKQRKKAIELKDEMFKDPGDGLFQGRNYQFVLNEPIGNLWAGIRHDAIDYFKNNAIQWWNGDEEEPTGHLLSSQVSCVNHLYFLRQRNDLATAILKNIDSRIISAEIVDNGFVEFEINGEKNYLNERSHVRGANSTSVDAAMIGKKNDGKNILILIEWKYTEFYSPKNLYIPERYNTYNPLLNDPNCPINSTDFESLYYEPYYQLMRQTLLGWKMVEANEYNCNEYLHLHIIPKDNKELQNKITSPKLAGKDMSDAWTNILKEPNKYKKLSPEELFEPLKNRKDIHALLEYLRERYW